MAKAKLKQARMRREWEGKRRLLQEEFERGLKKTEQLVEGEADLSTFSTGGTGCSSVGHAAAPVAGVISGQQSAYVSATRSTGGDASPEQDHAAFEDSASTSTGAATGAVSAGLFSDCMTTAGQGRGLGAARPRAPSSTKNNSKHRGKLRSKDEHSLPFWSVQVSDVEAAARTSDGLAAAVMGRGYVSPSCIVLLPHTKNAQIALYSYSHTFIFTHMHTLTLITHTGRKWDVLFLWLCWLWLSWGTLLSCPLGWSSHLTVIRLFPPDSRQQARPDGRVS